MVELRCEELPVSMVGPALAALERGLLSLLKGVDHGASRTFATPRRLAVLIADVAEGRPIVERKITGPPADRAFQDGKPTRAAEGFARGKGVDVSALEVVDGPRGKVVAVTVKEGGEQTAGLLAAGLEGVVLGLPFAQSMEWGEGGVRFGRPLHQVSVLYDNNVVEGEVAGLPVGNTTVGHRLAEGDSFSFHDSLEWLEGLRARQVEPDFEVRREQIHALLDEAAKRLEADPIDEPALLEEVTHLVEWPVLVLGEFDEDLLELPPRLLVQAMKSHQRYFPVHRAGRLTNRFVIISNNPWGNTALVAEGNARVLRARFYDARFFFSEDRKQRLEEHGKELERMRWIRGLGTMANKQVRVAALSQALSSLVGADPAAAKRAGLLCKSDLTTQMVGEFPELQGHMGRLYALEQGEPEAVAIAVEEHYQPRFSGDDPPTTAEGAAVALADRLDTLVGCFGVGMVPSGSGDPQGLRRAASGVLAILERHRLRTDLHDLYRNALLGFHAFACEADGHFERWAKTHGKWPSPGGEGALLRELVNFTLTRFKAAAVADGATPDLVDAVIEVTDPDPMVLEAKLAALRSLAQSDQFEPILQTFKRVLNISRDVDADPPARESLADPAERALADALDGLRSKVATATEALDFDRSLRHMLELQAPVATFFEAVLVDDPDPAVKARRMGLLAEVADVFRALADFSRISTR
ncbi:MAG: glycine--tRNA ligase subunit beta [Deltaproteobacteria bacterium]|nr:glycine--tRNA ligase subunit beta [Deltaproteobacteria bacterium]